MENVENKVVIITGASSGIGEETAKVLAENGAKVVLSARREDRLQKLVQEIGEDKAAYLKSDVTNLEDMKNLVSLAKEKFGHVDVLFANAGVMPVSSMSQNEVKQWNMMIDVNIRGILYAMSAVLPEFINQKKGQIIATSSVAGTRPVPGNAVYAGTKYFVKGFMESFREESIQEGNHIRTTVLYPGAINTELLNAITSDNLKHAVEDIYAKVGISPEAVAKAVLYAVSQPDDVDISDLIVRPSLEA